MDAQGKNKILKIVGFGLIVWELALKYAYALARLTFKNGWIEFPKVDEYGVYVDYYLLTINPTYVNLTFTGFAGEVWYNDYHITDAVVPRQTIKGHAYNGLKFSFLIPWNVLTSQSITEELMERLINGTLFDATMTINGRFFIAGKSLPINLKINLSDLKK